MFYKEYCNGKLSLFRRYALDGDGIEYEIGDVCYDLFQSVPLGRIFKFVTENGYIYAVINGCRYDISQLYADA